METTLVPSHKLAHTKADDVMVTFGDAGLGAKSESPLVKRSTAVEGASPYNDYYSYYVVLSE